MSTTETGQLPVDSFNMLWIELTNRCNLNCIHCYAESNPHSGETDRLQFKDYCAVISEAAALGCKYVQFTGGEATLSNDLVPLIVFAKDRGIPRIEVYTNLTRLPRDFLKCIVSNNVTIATSLYSFDPKVHDRITKSPGSFVRTVRNIAIVRDSGADLRVGVIAMRENEAEIEETVAFVRRMGIDRIGIDRARSFGRAIEGSGRESCMSELCGRCGDKRISVAADGTVAPCVMSKNWSIGSVLRASLSDLLVGSEMAVFRHQLGETIALNKRQGVTTCCQPGVIDTDVTTNALESVEDRYLEIEFPGENWAA